MNKQTVCCFTGHRKISGDVLPRIEKGLDEIIAELAAQGVVSHLSGMALGFDTMAARAVIKARELNAGIKLTAVLPCYGQEALWSEKDKQIYRQLSAKADSTVYVSEQPYYDGCMAKRNLFLTENSAVCVAYVKHSRSGSAQTMRFAHERGLRIINLAENLAKRISRDFRTLRAMSRLFYLFTAASPRKIASACSHSFS